MGDGVIGSARLFAQGRQSNLFRSRRKAIFGSPIRAAVAGLAGRPRPASVCRGRAVAANRARPPGLGWPTRPGADAVFLAVLCHLTAVAFVYHVAIRPLTVEMAMNSSISRFPVPALDEMPADVRSRILEVQEKAGFVRTSFSRWHIAR